MCIKDLLVTMIVNIFEHQDSLAPSSLHRGWKGASSSPSPRIDGNDGGGNVIGVN